MIDLLTFHDPEIRLMELLMRPQIAKHFPVITEKRHPVFPGFRDLFVEPKDMFPEELQTAFYRLVFEKEIVVDWPHHVPNCFIRQDIDFGINACQGKY